MRDKEWVAKGRNLGYNSCGLFCVPAAQFGTMKIPSKIEPSPLVEAVVDVRFMPDIPPAAVFGYVHGLLKGRYGDISGLPILQVPEEIREKDPNLIFQPYYRMVNKPFVLQLGPRVFNLAALDPAYPGWNSFRNEICGIFGALSENGVIGDIARVGIRYINFFEFNVFEVTNFFVALGDTSLSNHKTLLRVQFSDDGFETTVQVTNDGNLRIGKQPKRGSVVDLDTYYLRPPLVEKRDQGFLDLIEIAHRILKQRFFSGLKKEFVASLNPQYE